MDWLIDWLTDDWSIDWLIDWLVDWLIGWLIDWLIDWLTDDWSIDWLIGWLIDWLIERLFLPFLVFFSPFFGLVSPLDPAFCASHGDGDFDSPFILQLFPLPTDEDSAEAGELAVHDIVHDCNFEVDRQRFTAQWTANDFALSSKTAERAHFQVKFSNEPALLEFERIFLDGIALAEESDVSLLNTISGIWFFCFQGTNIAIVRITFFSFLSLNL